MEPNIDDVLASQSNPTVLQPNTKTYFEEMLKRIGLAHLTVHSLPPYVALTDPNYWQVVSCTKVADLCSYQANYAQNVLLCHVETGRRLGVFNCHIPSPTSTPARKTATVRKMSAILATVHTLPHWIIGGDCNLSAATLQWECRENVTPNVTNIATSGHDMTDVRKADFALCEGILLEKVVSWVGWSLKPAFSDAHNAVPVVGILSPAGRSRTQPSSGQTNRS